MLVQFLMASGVARHKPDSKAEFKASLCSMAAYNHCIDLKAFLVRLSELYKELNDIVPKPGEKMLKGQGRHTLHSTQAGSPKQRLCDFVMYLFKKAFGCVVKDGTGTYPIKLYGETLCDIEKPKRGLVFIDVEVRSQPPLPPPMPPPLPPPLPDACLLHPVYAAHEGHRGR